jgi:hypothetical protein
VQEIYPQGITSKETFGTPKTKFYINQCGGIESAEAWGTPTLKLYVRKAGRIESGMEFGDPQLKLSCRQVSHLVKLSARRTLSCYCIQTASRAKNPLNLRN